MRGLVQQQFKVLAAVAARQEQLAAMKARRLEALGAGEHGEQEDSPHGTLCNAGGAEVDQEGEQEAALLGSLHPRHARPPAEGDAVEEEADTPHQREWNRVQSRSTCELLLGLCTTQGAAYPMHTGVEGMHVSVHR